MCRWRADDGPFVVIFGSSIPPSTKRFEPPLTKLSGSAHACAGTTVSLYFSDFFYTFPFSINVTKHAIHVHLYKCSTTASTIKEGDSDRDVITCFGTLLKLTVDLTVIESDIDFGIYLTSLS